MEIDAWKFLAGLMLFLLAMSFVEQAVHALAGRRFKALIAANTNTPLRGIVSGTVATAVLQSSSMVSLMMLAFVGARVIRMRDALLVVFGANLGTTATGWIVAAIGFKLDLEALALPLIAMGGLLSTVVQKRRATDLGRFMLGVGLLLLALQFMKGAVDEVSTLIEPATLTALSPFEYLLLGTVFSAVVQSSSATMVITLSLLDAGVLGLGSAAALMIGADLGTTSTVLLGAIRGTPNKKRLACGHFLFNLITDAAAFLLRLPLLAALAFIEDPLLTLVAFHSAFNLLGLVVWTPFIGRFADFLDGRFVAVGDKVSLYLEDTAQAVPETAIPALRREIEHLVERVVTQNGSLFSVPPPDQQAPAEDFADAYATTKTLEGEILSYALDLDRRALTAQDNETIAALLHVTRDALISSKQLKDAIGDLDELEGQNPELYRFLSEVQRNFYLRLRDITEHPAVITLPQIEELAQEVEEGHRRCHERIYKDIQADALPEARMSSVLNVNRSFFNANRALLSSIGELAELRAAGVHSRLMPPDPSRLRTRGFRA